MKLKANKESYGFMKRIWSVGEIVEVLADTEYPKEHFDVIGAEAEKPKAPPKVESKPKAHKEK